MAICEQCGKEYKANRVDSKTCGPTCRQARARLSVTLSVTNAKCDTPAPVTDSDTQSLNRKCGSIPGDPGNDGVALQEKYRDHWAHLDGVEFRPDDVAKAKAGMDAMGFRRVLPDYVPDIIQERYARDSEYRTTIHRLIDTSVPDLQAAGVFIPVWRYQADIAP